MYVYRFGGNTKERDCLENRGVNGRMILECMLRDRCYGVAWLDVVQHSDK
jgi:hypothetical protein